MKRKILYLITIFLCVLFLGGCVGGYYHGVRGPGFYHSTYGHGWGGGHYRAMHAVDTARTIDAIDTIDTIETIDAMDSMDMDMDMGMPDIDF